jgi:GFO/IDH/MocA C-terminal domain
MRIGLIGLGRIGALHAETLSANPSVDELLVTDVVPGVSGGIFRDCAIHDFDAVRSATGRDGVEVFAVGSNRRDRFFADVGDVDTAPPVRWLPGSRPAGSPRPAPDRSASTGRFGWSRSDPRLEMQQPSRSSTRPSVRRSRRTS